MWSRSHRTRMQMRLKVPFEDFLELVSTAVTPVSSSALRYSRRDYPSSSQVSWFLNTRSYSPSTFQLSTSMYLIVWLSSTPSWAFCSPALIGCLTSPFLSADFEVSCFSRIPPCSLCRGALICPLTTQWWRSRYFREGTFALFFAFHR